MSIPRHVEIKRAHGSDDPQGDRKTTRRRVVEMKKYEITVQRSNGRWSFSIPEIDGAFDQAERLEQVEPEASDVIWLMTDNDEGTFAFTRDVRDHLTEE